MSPAKGKKTKKRTARGQELVEQHGLDPLRTGMPALDSITAVTTGKKKNAGKKYKFIHTDEVDEYEQRPSRREQKKLTGPRRKS